MESSIAGLAAAERVVFSPSGTAAALYASGSVQVINGLPGHRRGGGDHPRARQREGAVPSGDLAISDDGAYLLYSAAARWN